MKLYKMNSQLVLGYQSSRNASKPAKVKDTIFKYQASAIPSTTTSGGQFQLIADSGPVYPGSKDTVGVSGTGFKLTDFITTNTISQYDYFRVKKIEYLGSLSNIPRQAVPNVLVYSSIDWDDVTVSTFPSFMKRPNKALTVFTATAPTQKLLEYVPRRRISGNAESSLQIVPSVNEWLDCAYADSLIFGNAKFGICCPDGQAQYLVSDQCSVLVSAVLWVEFKGRISA